MLSEVKGEAVFLDDKEKGEVTVGTGVCLVSARLNCLIPNIIPIQCKIIKVSYQRECKGTAEHCYGYHKREKHDEMQSRILGCQGGDDFTVCT